MEVTTMAVSPDDELAKLRAQRMAQIQTQLEEQAAVQAEAEIKEDLKSNIEHYSAFWKQYNCPGSLTDPG